MSDWAAFAPADPAATVWDFVIIGAGMGGSVAGYHLARQGYRVLFLERGEAPPNKPTSVRAGRLQRLFGLQDRQARLKQAGAWHKPLSRRAGTHNIEFYAPMGAGPGGSSAIYGGALERLRRQDFAASAGEDPAARALPDGWPISYDAFAPFYKQAETLFEVAGTRDPGDPDDDSELMAPPPLSARDRYFFDAFEQAGMQPYRVHTGFRYRPGCTECLGVPCHNDCKSEGASRALRPALQRHGARLLLNCEVERLEADAASVKAVIARHAGQRLRITARVFILAAGALNSPVLLQRSRGEAWPNGIGNQHDMVGRGLMFHCGDLIMLSAPRRLDPAGPRKTLSSRAFYQSGGVRLGSFQSLGLPVYHGHVFDFMMAWLDLRLKRRLPLSRIAVKCLSILTAEYYKNITLFATILEDFPYHANRVVADASTPSGFYIDYTKSRHLDERMQLLRTLLKQALAPHGPVFLTSGDGMNIGHPMGTCRFGADPRSSVLDVNNKVHGVENLYLADASFMPSSGGSNPSLTVAANAIRIAQILARAHAEQLARSPQPS